MARTEPRRGRELRYYFEVIVRWFWFLGLCTLLAGSGAYVASKLVPPFYRATALLIVDQQASGQDPYSSLLASDQLVTTYVSLITQPTVLERAASRVKGTSAAALANQVQASAQTSTQIIQLQVDDTDPRRAADLANAVAQAFIEVQQQATIAKFNDVMQQLSQELGQASLQIDSLTKRINALRASNPGDPAIAPLQQQLDSTMARRASLQAASNQLTLLAIAAGNNIQIIQPATPPIRPDHPNPLFNSLVGAVLGLILAMGVVLLREFLDDRVRTADHIENLIGVATIGTITRRKGDNLLLSVKSNSRLDESFRIIRTNLSFMSLDKPLRSIAVTSPIPDEGKTTIAINLAISLARSGKRVLLVDADLRRPMIHKHLGMQNAEGLSLALVAGGQNATFTDVPNLYVLTSGPKPPNPTELLESERMHQLLRSMLTPNVKHEYFDVAVIDTPPALGFADAAVLAAYVDGVILVVDARGTREGALIKTMEALKRVNARIVGVILNGVKRISSDDYYSYDEEYGDRAKKEGVAHTHTGAAPPIDEVGGMNTPMTFPVDSRVNIAIPETPPTEEVVDSITPQAPPTSEKVDPDMTITLPHSSQQKLKGEE